MPCLRLPYMTYWLCHAVSAERYYTPTPTYQPPVLLRAVADAEQPYSDLLPSAYAYCQHDKLPCCKTHTPSSIQYIVVWCALCWRCTPVWTVIILEALYFKTCGRKSHTLHLEHDASATHASVGGDVVTGTFLPSTYCRSVLV